jgi:hypothetical protein
VEVQPTKYERSTIEFPYLDLDDAVQVAKGIHQIGGTSCELVQLAAELKQAVNGGGFRARIVAARVYGVITSDRGTATLTDLGKRIADPTQEKAARADAFLTVPLYRAIYDKFKGAALPPVSALEAEIVALGVGSKLKDKARQVFQRSAREGGFFAYGTDRLVMPSTFGRPPKGEGATHEVRDQTRRITPVEEELHPFIQGLLRKLPTPDTDWPIDSRSKWLETAANIFDLMYTDSDDSRRSIVIELKRKDSAK